MRPLQKKRKPRIGFRSSRKSSLVKTMQQNGAKNSKCNICLTMIQDPTYLNPCNHQFCFKCIQKWSRKKVICPLCKQRFYSFCHTIHRKDAFCEYILPLNGGSFSPSESKEDCTSASSQRLTSLPDNGIVHNKISGTLTQREKDIYQLMRQFAVTERPNDIDLISLGKFKAQAVIQFRRTLYHAGILVQNTPNPDFSQISSAEFFGRNPQCLDRVIPWLKRELKVLFGKRSTIHTLQNLILSNLIHHDLDSKEFEAILQPHMHRFTRHFLHEFMSFVQSSLNLKRYDWCALYECPAILKESDFSTSSPSSENEHLQRPEKSQVPKPNSNYGNLSFFLPSSEKALPSTFATADDKNHSTNEEKYMDLSNKDTEKGIATAFRIIKNILLKTPSEEQVQVSGSHSHSHLFQGQKEKKDLVEIDPVQILRPTDMDTGKNELEFVDDGTFKIYHKNSANIITVKKLGKKDTAKYHPSEVSINKLKEYSSAWSKTRSPKRRSVHKNSGSKGSIECKFDKACSASKGRHGGRNKAKYLQDEKKGRYYSRDRRHRRDQRKSKSKEASLLHKSPLPVRKKSTEARDTHKSKSQNIHHKRKMKNKNSEHLGSGSSSEPNQNCLYPKLRHEEPACRKDYRNQKHYLGDPEDTDKSPCASTTPLKGCK